MHDYHNQLTNENILEVNNTLQLSTKYIENKRFSLALNILEKAESKFSNIPEIFFNIAISNFLQAKVYFDKKDYSIAIPLYKTAEDYFLKANNQKYLSALYINLSICYQYYRNYSDMKSCHEKIFNLKPRPEFAAALLSYSKLCCADWEGLDNILNDAYKELKENISSIRPFTCMLVIDSPKLQYLSAVNFSNQYIN